MPIKTRCESCQAQFKVRDEAFGRTVKCPACGEPKLVGFETLESNVPPEAPAPKPKATPALPGSKGDGPAVSAVASVASTATAGNLGGGRCGRDAELQVDHPNVVYVSAAI